MNDEDTQYCPRSYSICLQFFSVFACLKWIDQISKACQAAVIRNLWIKAAPILLSLLGLPPNRFGRVDSRRCSCSGREWKWAHWSRAVWADFPLAFVLSLPSLLWGSEVPQHPVGPMGAEALDQPVERFLFFKSNPENGLNICTHHHHIICMQEVVETNFITPVTSSTWRTPGLFPAGIELLSALCEKGVHLGTSDPAHMVMTPPTVPCSLIRIRLFVVKDSNTALVYLSVCSGPSAATSPGLKQTWPYQFSAPTLPLKLVRRRECAAFENQIHRCREHIDLCHHRNTWWNETLSALKAIKMKMSMFAVHLQLSPASQVLDLLSYT